jgi:predicted nucleic acid-binding protein
MRTAVRNAAEASGLLHALCQQSGVQLAEPEHNGWEVFHQLLRNAELPARLCTDGHQAALAIATGWRLVSFDRDFERLEGLERLALA